MKSIIVQRPPADRQGPDIISPQIRTEAQAIARATAEIDQNCSDRVAVTGAMPLQALLMPGAIIEVTDAERGGYRAMVRTMSFTIDRSADTLTATSNIQLERVA
jgi:hypothetical protein